MYLETCWFGSPALGFETTRLPNLWRCLTHTELGGSGQGNRESMVLHDSQHPRSMGCLALHIDIHHWLIARLTPMFCVIQHILDASTARTDSTSMQPVLGLAVCISCYAAAPAAEFGATGAHSLTPPSMEMHSDAWYLGLLPLQLVQGPGSHRSTRAWVSRVLTQGFPGQHLPKLYQEMGFLLPQNRNLREGEKPLADTSVCIWSCSCWRKNLGRILQHMPTAKGWWRKGLEDRGRVTMWRSAGGFKRKQVPRAGGRSRCAH